MIIIFLRNFIYKAKSKKHLYIADKSNVIKVKAPSAANICKIKLRAAWDKKDLDTVLQILLQRAKKYHDSIRQISSLCHP